MSSKIKRILSIMMCLMILLSVAACAKPTDNTHTDQPKQSKPSEDKYGRYDPPIEVTTILVSDDAAFWFPEGDSLDQNIYTRRWEEELGIKYKFIWTCPGSQAEEKMSVMMASDNLPDVMNVSRKNYEQLQKAGKLADMTDAINNYASDYTKKYLTGDYAPMLDAVTKEDKYWGVPNGMTYQDMSHAIWIRADWLDNLGLSIPTTTKELEKIMDAFLNNDPDGNGQHDTYSVILGAADMGNTDFGVANIFFNMFHSYPNIWVMNSTGELEDGMFGLEHRENTRNALLAFSQYYEKGYFHKEFGLFDNNRVREEIMNERAGIVFGHTWDPWENLMFSLDVNENADWVPIPVPSSDGSPAKMASKAVDVFSVNVASKDFEHPEALVKMCNLFHDLNNNPETMEFNEYNTNPEDNNQIFLAYPLHVFNPTFNYDAYLDIATAIDANDESHLCEAYKSFYDLAMAFKNEGDVAGFPSYRTYTEDGIMALSKYYDENKLIQFDEYAQEPTQFMIENWPTIKKSYDQMFLNVALGKEDLSAFDEFLQQYDRIYRDQSAKDVNDWYNANGKNSTQEWFDNK